VTHIDDLPAFYARIREGAPTSPRVLATLQERYRAIGGGSPLNAITQSCATKLQQAIDTRYGAREILVRAGFRHVAPYADEVLEGLVREGVTRALAIPMSPHISRFVQEGYARSIAGSTCGIHVEMVGPWHMESALLDFWSRSLTASLSQVPEGEREAAQVLFSAHSLPTRWVAGDDLVGRLRESADAVAKAAGVPTSRVSHVWQSASPTGEEWLGPDINLQILSGLPPGTRAVVSCPHGFLADHLETLYDIDILARQSAEGRGLTFVRTQMPNDSPLLVQALVNVVERSRQALA
jgi:ferrochelatase